MNEPKLGAAIALPAYVALLAGMFFIGGQLQLRDVVSGLWITEAVAIALPAFFVVSAAGVRVGKYLGLRRITWKQALIAAVVAAANQPVVSFLTWVGREILPKPLVDQFDDQQRLLSTLFVGRAAWVMVLTVCIAAPLGEEIFFRGYFFPSLRKSWGMVAALLVSGACFSLVHGEWVGFLGLMEIGVLLAALRVWSGSLWAAVVGHAVNNAIAGGAFLLDLQDPDAPTPVWLLLLGLALFVAGIFLLMNVLKKAAPLEEERAPRKASAPLAMATVWSLTLAVGIWLWRRHG